MPPHAPTPPRAPDPESRDRERLATFLAIVLALFLGGGFLLFLTVITVNLVLGVLGVAAATAAYVGVHYLLWGRHG